MSIESAKEFVKRMNADETFRKKVLECKDQNERKAFVEKEGFDFDGKEIKQVKSELSDDDLAKVVGGDHGCTPDWSGVCRWMLFDFI
jgi:predicted ribosomally synthesized peptide with nif11-like leader